MPSKPSKSAVKPKASVPKKRPAAARVVTSKSSSKPAVPSQQARNKYVAGAVLIAAALVAIAVALPSYHNYKANNSAVTTPSAIRATMYTSAPDSHDVIRPNSTMTINIYANSGKNSVNAVQSIVHYPADKLQLLSVKPSQAFPREAATDTATPGLVRLARAVNNNAEAVNGSNVVATLEFNVLPGASGTVDINVDKASSLVVSSTDNKNLLDQAVTTTYRVEQ